MQRRTFLKHTGAAGLLTLITPSGFVQALAQKTVAGMEEGFRHPPVSAHAHTWWHWMNGHVSREGITLDLEAMKRVGIGGFQNFFVGSGIPKGPVEYLSAEWLSLMQHTIREADRLGLEFQMHNCPGWSSTGGPWVTPEWSMQQLVWSETFVAGGKAVRQPLPKPFHRLDYYNDAYVLAFPSLEGETAAWSDGLQEVIADGKTYDPKAFAAGIKQAIALVPKSEAEPASMLFRFAQPLPVQSLLLYATAITEPSGGGILSIAPIIVESSDDGRNFSRLGVIGQVGGETPGATSFAKTTATYFRLLFTRPSRFHQISISGAARIADWTTKANYAGPNPGMVMAEAAVTGNVPAGDIIDPRSVLDISAYMDAAGNLNWNAPAGNWTILRMGHTTTARINKAAPTTGEGLEVDKFSAAAYEFHFNKMFSSLLPLLEPLGKKGKVGVLVDSYEVGMQNWTKTFPSDFKKNRGYDLLSWLPAMTGRVVGGADASDRFLWDLRRVQADLIADNYYARCTELCRKHGFISYTEPYNGGPLEQMQVGSRIDINMGEFWVRSAHFRHSMKLAASIQHINGRKVVGAEAFTGHALFSKWQEHPYAMKALGDYMFTRGLNRMIFHRYAHQPHPTALPGMTMGPWGFHFDRTNTWFEQGKAWLRYLARCQYLLQSGLFVADLLYFTGEDAPGQDISLRATLLPAPPKGYDYDNVNTEVLLRKVTVKDNRVVLPDGMSYRLLVLPEGKGMSLALLRKIHALVQEGMALVVGNKPQKASGLVGYPESDAEMQRLVADLWGNMNGEKGVRLLGKGKVFLSGDLADVLQQLDLPPDFSFTARSADPAISYIHRNIDNAEVYFIANGKRREEELVCTFRVANKRPEIWNADTGEIIPLDLYGTADGRVRLPLVLEPAGSVFVVFREAASGKRITAIAKDGKPLVAVTDFTAQPNRRQADVVNSFTLAAWIKPECDMALPGDAANAAMLQRFGPRSFVFYPVAGDVLYGAGHAIAGVLAARNGVAVYERTTEGFTLAAAALVPLSGWTHLALVYRNGTPQVFVNGEQVATGKASSYQVHPAFGEEYHDESLPYFEGEVRGKTLFREVLSPDRITQLVAAQPPLAESTLLQWSAKVKSGMLFLQNGTYAVQDASGKTSSFRLSVDKPVVLDGAWDVQFPHGLGAPASVRLPKLVSLHQHEEDGVRYFSGTATYRKQFAVPAAARATGKRLLLDLGQVEVMAEVLVNGKNMGILWKPPFMVDVTDAVTSGNNQLEVKVTNLWPNRLIGDEQLPATDPYDSIAFNQKGGITAMPDWYVKGQPKPDDGRVTFTTWKHYNKDAPLLPSGLVGPVVLRSAAELNGAGMV